LSNGGSLKSSRGTRIREDSKQPSTGGGVTRRGIKKKGGMDTFAKSLKAGGVVPRFKKNVLKEKAAGVQVGRLV